MMIITSISNLAQRPPLCVSAFSEILQTLRAVDLRIRSDYELTRSLRRWPIGERQTAGDSGQPKAEFASLSVSIMLIKVRQSPSSPSNFGRAQRRLPSPLYDYDWSALMSTSASA
jgi:hypothetical protein